MKKHSARGLLPLALLFGFSTPSESTPVVDEISWSTMLADHDLAWGSLPTSWDEAPFLGNGEQGTMMYQLDNQTLRWDVGCSAAHDHRSADDDDLGEKHVEVLNRGRLFIGHLELELPENILSSQSRLSLWNAESTGTIEAGGGSLTWNTLVHATEPVMRFDFTPTGSLAETEMTYVPEEAKNPRAVRSGAERSPANPGAVLTTLSDGVKTAVHNLWAGGQTAVAYYQTEVGGTQRLWLSVQHSYPDSTAEDSAVAAVRAAAAADQEEWVQEHRDWWHGYYPASFVSTGDPYWDAFYWVQQYKLACATRDKGWIIDNQGPWLQPTAWNATWWNLNVQLSHTGVYKANRREMGSALSHRLDINRDNLARNVAEEYRSDSYAIGRTASGWDLLGHVGEPGIRSEIGDTNIGRESANLLWALHNVDQEYRYWMDIELRDDVLYPILVRAVNYYRHFLEEERDGYYHLPSTHSPEYANAEDCSYDLDLLRWGVGRLLELATEKGLSPADEPLINVWTDIQTKLVPNHTNATGRMIGRNRALTGGHRHWSHLLAIYPLRTLTPESAADRELIQTSLDHWQSFGSGIAGYAFTSASCISSMLGNGDDALTYLNGLKSYLQPSTMYSEIGLPVMETPLHGATAIQEMMLQSWGGRLRVFPAVASTWPDAKFQKLRGEGGYLTTASRKDGETEWVFVESEFGGVVEVEPQLIGAQWSASSGVTVTSSGSGVYEIETAPGDWVFFWPAGEAQPEAVVEPVEERGGNYRFGLTSGYVEVDTTPPVPDPLTWSIAPAPYDSSSILMEATLASDDSEPIEYSFLNTTNGDSSGWMTSRSWTNTGLIEGQEYCFQVQARDAAGNVGQWSEVACATPAEDTVAPTPSPMTWASRPSAVSDSVMVMTATTASDAAGVEYYFTNTSFPDGSHDSGWQESPTFVDTGLSPESSYTYTVVARDRSAAQNETAASGEAGAMTGQPMTIGPIAGVDFEDEADSAFDRTPDDLAPDDGVSVSADWTIFGDVDVISDGGGNNAGSTSGSYPAKLNAGSSEANPPAYAPTDHYYSWSLTVPEDVVLNLASISFDWRQGTGTASQTRWGIFNTSLDGGPGGTKLWELEDPVVRPNWENVTIDLSESLYQGLTDTTVTFYWYTERTGSDIDSIVVTGSTSEIIDDYGSWAAIYPEADLSNPEADFDGDGMANGEERIWGLDPTNSGSVSPYTSALSSTGSFGYTRRDPSLSG
ncbi:MAG: hypothetical protein Q7Q71_08615, partial [Verrucomicrobiota bacterium JB023]|nr:hypothetical protein [Verrucomicrobiota bacterium JB023]